MNCEEYLRELGKVILEVKKSFWNVRAKLRKVTLEVKKSFWNVWAKLRKVTLEVKGSFWNVWARLSPTQSCSLPAGKQVFLTFVFSFSYFPVIIVFKCQVSLINMAQLSPDQLNAQRSFQKKVPTNCKPSSHTGNLPGIHHAEQSSTFYKRQTRLLTL